MRASIEKFLDSAHTFLCPLCASSFMASGTSLICAHHHTFDIAAKGYISFLKTGNSTNELYDQAFFENRSLLLKNGLYAHIIQGVAEAVLRIFEKRDTYSNDATHTPASQLLDVGCGDGTLTRQLQSIIRTAADRQLTDARQHALHALASSIYACDIAAPAISIAARGGGDIRWFMADLAQLPIANHSIDIITDIFSPANYEEFKRVMKAHGKLVKVVPAAHHLVELRNCIAASRGEKTEGYSNENVIRVLEQHCTIEQTSTVSATIDLSPEEWKQFLAMTPLMFHIDRSTIDISTLHQLTIEAEIIEAAMK